MVDTAEVGHTEYRIHSDITSRNVPETHTDFLGRDCKRSTQE
jgi:hypothetical protein